MSTVKQFKIGQTIGGAVFVVAFVGLLFGALLGVGGTAIAVLLAGSIVGFAAHLGFRWAAWMDSEE